MVCENETVCPRCGGSLRYYDSVKRIVRTKNRVSRHVIIRRVRCEKCNLLHRELPDYIFPYKQYEVEVILGVIENIITTETLGYEDYPCEMTMNRWLSQQEYITQQLYLLFGGA